MPNGCTLDVTGGTKVAREICWGATDAILLKLLPPEVVSQLSIEILIEKDMDSKGECMWQDRRVKPREFEITMESRLKPYAILSTLAHELVHVAQYTTGRMVDDSDFHGVTWEGKYYSCPDYYTCPWELEAYGRQFGLAEKYLVENGLTKAAWARDPDYL